jgi:RNase adaptor protein for sRNA GlmZ degradation
MITLKSHGFKFSRPDANIVFDVSYFANPWRDKEIREEINAEDRKQKVIEFMCKQEGAYELADNIAELIKQYDNLFPNENIQIALACSAGEYRSPAMVEIVAKLLGKTNYKIIHNENSKI